MSTSQQLEELRKKNEELLDTVDGLESELFEAVEVAYNRGAQSWVQLNYPKWFEILSKQS